MNEDQYADIKAQLSANAKEHESYNRRLAEHDESLKKLSETQVILERLSNAVNNLSASVGEIKVSVQSVGTRLDAIEREPADNWKKITFEVVKYIALALVGAAVGYFIKGA